MIVDIACNDGIADAKAGAAVNSSPIGTSDRSPNGIASDGRTPDFPATARNPPPLAMLTLPEMVLLIMFMNPF